METERLLLQTWDEDAFKRFHNGTNTPSVMRWLGGVMNDEQLAALYQRHTGFFTAFGHGFWIVVRKEDGEVLGFCGIKRVDAQGTDLTGQHEIGWRFREDSWGKGYAKEAAAASLDYAFVKLEAPHVVAFTVAGNSASWGLMERLGMTRRPDFDFDDPRFGRDLNPTIVYRIAKAEWKGL
ncbi:GNAT family N-acetyltransferase [Rhizorhapis suberifaciens]|uniref:RimJ/RimL family protein N-acetyltransferase n=1 Tax=Rhizorhapis suberifaciens TaxID=13656 RepID=A0A840HT26_9SPHN|nr:GNAT family N-acetyltransferase [Rhizorhapis suberifaciens]MBB4641332.1 RimJ/RimL family protein N-acetyltransferase [Rhizorhapis suberifaciens]